MKIKGNSTKIIAYGGLFFATRHRMAEIFFEPKIMVKGKTKKHCTSRLRK